MTLRLSIRVTRSVLISYHKKKRNLFDSIEATNDSQSFLAYLLIYFIHIFYGNRRRRVHLELKPHTLTLNNSFIC